MIPKRKQSHTANKKYNFVEEIQANKFEPSNLSALKNKTS